MENGNTSSILVRTGRGLTISGTRTTLYEVMDYLKADWPPARHGMNTILVDRNLGGKSPNRIASHYHR